MLVHRNAIEATKYAAAKTNNSQYSLTGICVRRGKTIATDGSILITHVCQKPADPADLPEVIRESGSADLPEGASVVIPTKMAVGLAKAARSKMPILNHITIAPKGNSYHLQTTDLGTVQDLVLPNNSSDHSFPPENIIERLTPKKTGDTITVGPDYLIAIGRAAKAIGAQSVTLTLADDAAKGPIQFRAETDEDQISGLLMPQRV